MYNKYTKKSHPRSIIPVHSVTVTRESISNVIILLWKQTHSPKPVTWNVLEPFKHLPYIRQLPIINFSISGERWYAPIAVRRWQAARCVQYPLTSWSGILWERRPALGVATLSLKLSRRSLAQWEKADWGFLEQNAEESIGIEQSWATASMFTVFKSRWRGWRDIYQAKEIEKLM